MVLASISIVFNNRLAARPVEAQSRHRTFLARRISRMALTRVILPTPGPPVMMSALLVSACLTVSRWLGASSLPVFSWLECKKTMISRMTLCSAQASLIFCLRLGPIPFTSRKG